MKNYFQWAYWLAAYEIADLRCRYFEHVTYGHIRAWGRVHPTEDAAHVRAMIARSRARTALQGVWA